MYFCVGSYIEILTSNNTEYSYTMEIIWPGVDNKTLGLQFSWASVVFAKKNLFFLSAKSIFSHFYYPCQRIVLQINNYYDQPFDP